MIVVNNERRNLRLAVDVFVVVDVFFFFVLFVLKVCELFSHRRVDDFISNKT